MTPDYKRGYGKGYATGLARSDRELKAANDRADDAARRAERAEAAHGLGHCDGCRHWSRGGGGPMSDRCSWGECSCPRAAGTPHDTWIRSDDGKPVTTSPKFGCVLWQPLPPPPTLGTHAAEPRKD